MATNQGVRGSNPLWRARRDGATESRLGFIRGGIFFCLAVRSLDILFVTQSQARRRHRIPSRAYLRRDIFLPRCPEFGYTFCNAITGATAPPKPYGSYLLYGFFLPRCPEFGYTFCNAITGATAPPKPYESYLLYVFFCLAAVIFVLFLAVLPTSVSKRE